ncbi:MAG TPA: hypothetical protein VF785_19700 [Gemmatimonadaceae bacterium]
MKASRGSLLALAIPAILGAQGLRISGVTTMQLVELRPLVLDSLAASLVPGTGESRTVAGVPAVCSVSSAFCQFERSGNRVSATPVLQDVTIAGWGWVEGLSFHGDVRARTQLSGDAAFVYPLTDDHLELLDAYAQLDRDTWQGRLGRQWVTGSLGAYAFDGANALWRHDALTLEGWSGRALVAGLNEPYTSAQLAAIDNTPPQQNGYLFGARARYRPDPLTAAALTYQRVLVADRSGLYSERASLDASTRQFSAALDLGLNYDFATGDWNEARLRVGTGGTGPLGYSIEARHSRPFFELWTIWGAFSPVGFDEARATVDWRPSTSQFSYSLRGAYRKYGASNTGISLRTNGWRAGGDARWQGEGALSAYGSYDVDIGSGAANTDVRAGGRWLAASGLSFGADLMMTQNIYEFRIGTGRIYGASLDGAVPITPDVRLVVDGGLYQHMLTNGAPGPDWTQRRASVRIEWMLGRDPGMGVKTP